MQTLLRVALAGVIQQSDIGQNNGVHALINGGVNRFAPVGNAPGLGEGVDRQQNLATLGVCIANALGHGFLIEIEPGKIARVGIVLETEINGIGAVIHRRFEGGQTTGGADEIGEFHGVVSRAEQRSIASLFSVPLILVKAESLRLDNIDATFRQSVRCGLEARE
jgi:hypothetical protein